MVNCRLGMIMMNSLCDIPIYHPYHILNNMENIGRLSAAYNTALGICRIGCENGNRETGARNTHEGGFEIRRGDSAFAISGRLYHSMAKYVSSTDPAGK
jgi:hypothetical protein